MTLASAKNPVSKYDVFVEFDKFRKEYHQCEEPEIVEMNGEKVGLKISESNGAVHIFNWDKIQSYHYRKPDRRETKSMRRS